MEHDFAGLERALARQDPLEQALVHLDFFRRHFAKDLTARQRVFLDTAIHTTACLLSDMLGGVSWDD